MENHGATSDEPSDDDEQAEFGQGGEHQDEAESAEGAYGSSGCDGMDWEVPSGCGKDTDELNDDGAGNNAFHIGR